MRRDCIVLSMMGLLAVHALSPEETELVGKILADNKVTDSNIKNSLIIDLVLGGFLLLSFSILQRSSILYRFRLYSPTVTSPPPELDTAGLRSLWAWVKGALVTSDLELLQSCGLDALMMVKVSALGVQLCLPLCICGLCILLPLHAAGKFLNNSEANTSGFMHYTISNIEPRSKLLWLHFVLVYVYIGYAMWLLRWHYRQYLVIRQHFLKKGEDVNEWRLLYEQDQASGLHAHAAARQGEGRLRALMGLIPVIRNLAANQVPVPDEDDKGQDVAPFAREAEEGPSDNGDEAEEDGFDLPWADVQAADDDTDERSSLLLSPGGTLHGRPAGSRRTTRDSPGAGSGPGLVGRALSLLRPHHNMQLQNLQLRRTTAEWARRSSAGQHRELPVVRRSLGGAYSREGQRGRRGTGEAVRLGSYGSPHSSRLGLSGRLGHFGAPHISTPSTLGPSLACALGMHKGGEMAAGASVSMRRAAQGTQGGMQEEEESGGLLPPGAPLSDSAPAHATAGAGAGAGSGSGSATGPQSSQLHGSFAKCSLLVRRFRRHSTEVPAVPVAAGDAAPVPGSTAVPPPRHSASPRLLPATSPRLILPAGIGMARSAFLQPPRFTSSPRPRTIQSQHIIQINSPASDALGSCGAASLAAGSGAGSGAPGLEHGFGGPEHGPPRPWHLHAGLLHSATIGSSVNMFSWPERRRRAAVLQQLIARELESAGLADEPVTPPACDTEAPPGDHAQAGHVVHSGPMPHAASYMEKGPSLEDVVVHTGIGLQPGSGPLSPGSGGHHFSWAHSGRVGRASGTSRSVCRSSGGGGGRGKAHIAAIAAASAAAAAAGTTGTAARAGRATDTQPTVNAAAAIGAAAAAGTQPASGAAPASAVGAIEPGLPAAASCAAVSSQLQHLAGGQAQAVPDQAHGVPQQARVLPDQAEISPEPPAIHHHSQLHIPHAATKRGELAGAGCMRREQGTAPDRIGKQNALGDRHAAPHVQHCEVQLVSSKEGKDGAGKSKQGSVGAGSGESSRGGSSGSGADGSGRGLPEQQKQQQQTQQTQRTPRVEQITPRGVEGVTKSKGADLSGGGEERARTSAATDGDDVLQDMPRWWGTVAVPNRPPGHARHMSSAAALGGAKSTVNSAGGTSAAQVGSRCATSANNSAGGGGRPVAGGSAGGVPGGAQLLKRHHRAASWGALMSQIDGDKDTSPKWQLPPAAVAGAGTAASPLKLPHTKSRSRSGTPTRAQAAATAATATPPATVATAAAATVAILLDSPHPPGPHEEDHVSWTVNPMAAELDAAFLGNTVNNLGNTNSPPAHGATLPVPPLQHMDRAVSLAAFLADGQCNAEEATVRVEMGEEEEWEGGEEEEEEGEGEGRVAAARMELLAMPSVRFRKTINTQDWRGRPVAVNAQHYAVLVTDVKQPLYGDPTDNALYAPSRAKRFVGHLARLAPWNLAAAAFGYAHHAQSAALAAPQGIPLSPGAGLGWSLGTAGQQEPSPWGPSSHRPEGHTAPDPAAMHPQSFPSGSTQSVTVAAASGGYQGAPSVPLSNMHGRGGDRDGTWRPPKGCEEECGKGIAECGGGGGAGSRAVHRRGASLAAVPSPLPPGSQPPDAACVLQVGGGSGIPKLVGLLEQLLAVAHNNNTNNSNNNSVGHASSAWGASPAPSGLPRFGGLELQPQSGAGAGSAGMSSPGEGAAASSGHTGHASNHNTQVHASTTAATAHMTPRDQAGRGPGPVCEGLDRNHGGEEEEEEEQEMLTHSLSSSQPLGDQDSSLLPTGHMGMHRRRTGRQGYSRLQGNGSSNPQASHLSGLVDPDDVAVQIGGQAVQAAQLQLPPPFYLPQLSTPSPSPHASLGALGSTGLPGGSTLVRSATLLASSAAAAAVGGGRLAMGSTIAAGSTGAAAHGVSGTPRGGAVLCTASTGQRTACTAPAATRPHSLPAGNQGWLAEATQSLLEAAEGSPTAAASVVPHADSAESQESEGGCASVIIHSTPSGSQAGSRGGSRATQPSSLRLSLSFLGGGEEEEEEEEEKGFGAGEGAATSCNSLISMKSDIRGAGGAGLAPRMRAQLQKEGQEVGGEEQPELLQLGQAPSLIDGLGCGLEGPLQHQLPSGAGHTGREHADGEAACYHTPTINNHNDNNSGGGGNGGGGGRGGGGGGEQGGGGSKWDMVRDAVWSGAVADLLYSRQYSTVTATFKRMFPDDFDRAIPVIRHKEVDALLLKLDEHLGAYEQAKLYMKRRGKRLYKRVGWLGLLGRRVDALEHHRQRVLEIQEELVAARKAALLHGATPSWFVFFKSQAAAIFASATTLHAEDNRHFKVQPAPGPEEVNWGALWLTFRQRDWRATITLPLLIALILIPVGIFAGGLQQLDYAFCPAHKCILEYDNVAVSGSSQHYNTTLLVANTTACEMVNGTVVSTNNRFEWKWYCEKTDVASQAMGFFVVGWLPSLLLIVWQGGILPLGLYLLVQMGGSCFSLSAVDSRIASWLFHFATFNVFLGGMLGSAIVQQINRSLEKGPAELLNLIGTSLPTSSNFFLNYLLFRAIVGIPARLLIPHVGVRLFLARRYLRCLWLLTERDKALLYAPVSPRYGFEYGMLLIVFLVALAFSVVSPVLLALAVLFFCLSWLFWRYSLLYVYVRKYESGGLMWPWVFRRLLACLLICALFTGCVFVVKEAYVQAFLLFATVPVLLHRFSKYCWVRYQKGIETLPLEYAYQAPRACVDPWVYIPPPLHHKAYGWWPDWSKPWGGWGMPTGTATL